MPTDGELLAQLNQKLDSFMQLYRDRHEELEKRVDKMEARIDIIDGKINGLHSNSMQWVNDALGQLERRILDKIEANSKSSVSNRIVIVFGIMSTLIGIGGVIVAILK